MTLDLTERCGGVRCSHALGEGRFGGITAYACVATYSRRINSKCQGSVRSRAGDPLNVIVDAQYIVRAFFRQTRCSRPYLAINLFILRRNGRKGT